MSRIPSWGRIVLITVLCSAAVIITDVDVWYFWTVPVFILPAVMMCVDETVLRVTKAVQLAADKAATQDRRNPESPMRSAS